MCTHYCNDVCLCLFYFNGCLKNAQIAGLLNVVKYGR